MAKLSPITSEFASTEAAEAHDLWVREKLRESLADSRPAVSHEDVMAEIDAIIEAERKGRVA